VKEYTKNFSGPNVNGKTSFEELCDWEGEGERDGKRERNRREKDRS
jgi:hypothetical protein